MSIVYCTVIEIFYSILNLKILIQNYVKSGNQFSRRNQLLNILLLKKL